MPLFNRSSFFVSISLLILSAVSVIDAYSQQSKLLYEIERQNTVEAKAPKFMHIARLSYYPDSLPGWFFNPPLSSGDVFYAIGVSDPDMTKDSANMQALERAKGMIAFQVDSKIQYFRDIYNIERVSGRYTETRSIHTTKSLLPFLFLVPILLLSIRTLLASTSKFCL